MIIPTAKLIRMTVLPGCVMLLVMSFLEYESWPVIAADTAAVEEIRSARQLMRDHQMKQADLLLSSLIKKYPNDAELAMARGDLLREKGRVDQASREFARAAELAPSNPFPLISLAELSLKQMELELSLTYAQQAVARDPSCLPARLCLIDVLLQCDQTAEAERQLRCLPADSKGKPAVEQLAYKLSLKKGDLAAASNHLSKALEGSDKGSLQLRLEQSQLLQIMGDSNSARSELEKVIRDSPDSLSARLRLARLLETQYHDYASALSAYTEALRLDPLSAQAIAGHDRCQLKRRNIALQIKMALREFWAKLQEEDAGAGSKFSAH